MSGLQFGHVGFCPPLRGAELASEDEALGFNIRYFGENTSYGSDPFAELRDAARATSRIRLAAGATNFVLRHPAVVANAIAGVQVLSGGRAICGVGTGDSAVAVVGRRPQRVDDFSADVELLSGYLKGETVRTGDWDSRIDWLDEIDYAAVPVEVMCSGPRAIAVAARFADRVTLTVGTAPERIAWALEVLDAGLQEAGRSRADIEIGAYVAVTVDDDRARAIERLRVRVKGIAHMATRPGIDLSAQPERLRTVAARLQAGYDYKHHNVRADNPLGRLVEPEFADWFGIGGPPGYVVERLGALAEAGLSYVFVAGMAGAERERFASEVMPQLARHAVS